MFRLFCLPGWLIAQLWYLWPKKGQILASSRRKENPFVHFVYAIVFYVICGFFLLGSLGGDSGRANSGVDTPAYSKAAPLASGSSEFEVPEPSLEPTMETKPDVIDETLAAVPNEEVPEVAEQEPASETIFVSEPVVQELPDDSDAGE